MLVLLRRSSQNRSARASLDPPHAAPLRRAGARRGGARGDRSGPLRFGGGADQGGKVRARLSEARREPAPRPRDGNAVLPRDLLREHGSTDESLVAVSGGCRRREGAGKRRAGEDGAGPRGGPRTQASAAHDLGARCRRGVAWTRRHARRSSPQAGCVGSPIPVDLGDHVVRATARGKVAWETRITVRAAGRNWK